MWCNSSVFCSSAKFMRSRIERETRHASSAHHRKMTAIVDPHGFHGVLQAGRFLDGSDVGSHYISDLGTLRVPAPDDHADQKIPFAERSP